MLAVAKSITFLLLAVILTTAALLVPTHLRSIDSKTVSYAGTTGPSTSDQIDLLIEAAQIGPARRLLHATDEAESERKLFRGQISQIQEEHPLYAISGGPNTYFENFLDLIQIEGTKSSQTAGVVKILLPRSERESLVGLLQKSPNANVATLLQARNISGLLRLHPASHPAGAPYDAGILTLALLTESGHFKNRFAQQIGTIARQSSLKDPSAIRAIEELSIATLSLGRVLEYESLTVLAELTSSPTEWARMGALFRARPELLNSLFTAILYAESPNQIFDYLAEHDETGFSDLQFALVNGPEALKALLDSNRALFQETRWTKWLSEKVPDTRLHFFVSLSFEHPKLALLFKLCLLLCSGLALAFALGALWRTYFQKGDAAIKHYSPIILLRDGLLSIVVTVAIWTAFEPDLLKSEKDAIDTTPRIQFAVADTLQSLKTPVKAMQELNQVTLLVLALFFVMQLVIYTFCLIKLKEIAKQKLSPAMKIRLLENEENLFDFGLYVGLGGTVSSLILVAVGIVEASLMAAYASTLFGILFTAVLKVMNIRPYRRKLILESGTGGGTRRGEGELMKNIEL